MYKKGFSLVEIIFVIAIIAVLITVAMGKFGNSLSQTNIIKIKADILNIQDGINRYKRSNILKNSNKPLESLELEGEKEQLFSAILEKPIKQSLEQRAKAWSKISDNSYKVYIDNQHYVQFDYDSQNNSFECDDEDPNCQKLIQ